MFVNSYYCMNYVIIAVTTTTITVLPVKFTQKQTQANETSEILHSLWSRVPNEIVFWCGAHTNKLCECVSLRFALAIFYIFDCNSSELEKHRKVKKKSEAIKQ